MVLTCGLISEKGVHKLIFVLLLWPSLASYPQKPFLAFTEVLGKIWREVTRKVPKSFLSSRKRRLPAREDSEIALAAAGAAPMHYNRRYLIINGDFWRRFVHFKGCKLRGGPRISRRMIM